MTFLSTSAMEFLLSAARAALGPVKSNDSGPSGFRIGGFFRDPGTAAAPWVTGDIPYVRGYSSPASRR